MEQRPLFRLAVEAAHVQCTYVHGQGWHVSIGIRRGDESWADARRTEYHRCTTAELLDIVCSELDAQL